jgi:hypothetical protein
MPLLYVVLQAKCITFEITQQEITPRLVKDGGAKRLITNELYLA